MRPAPLVVPSRCPEWQQGVAPQSAISEHPPRYLAAGDSQRRPTGDIVEESRFAGVDWASQEHAACVIDADGRIAEGGRYRHDERGIRALCARLDRARGSCWSPSSALTGR
jgi:hypothetical protein